MANRKTHEKEYRSWEAMKQRCNNPKNNMYHLYGGRGIKVCDHWEYFDNFLQDMGIKPSPRHTLDRINNEGNYEPSNCKWSTPKEQSSNKRGVLSVELNGEKLPLIDAAKKLGLSAAVLYWRVANGSTPQQAIIDYIELKRKKSLINMRNIRVVKRKRYTAYQLKFVNKEGRVENHTFRCLDECRKFRDLIMKDLYDSIGTRRKSESIKYHYGDMIVEPYLPSKEPVDA